METSFPVLLIHSKLVTEHIILEILYLRTLRPIIKRISSREDMHFLLLPDISVLPDHLRSNCRSGNFF